MIVYVSMCIYTSKYIIINILYDVDTRKKGWGHRNWPVP